MCPVGEPGRFNILPGRLEGSVHENVLKLERANWKSSSPAVSAKRYSARSGSGGMDWAEIAQKRTLTGPPKRIPLASYLKVDRESRSGRLGRLGFAGVALLELVDPACCINNFLLAGVERVAGSTDIHMQGI